MNSPPGGGAPARRAIVRWAVRLFRREWRQQAVILALLVVSVAAAVGFASAAYNTVGVSEEATFGSARHRYAVDAPAPAALPALIAAAENQLGPVDVIVRWTRPIPGSVDTVEYRAQDPAGAFSEPMLALREGRHPGAVDEVAVTNGVADTFGVGIGDTFYADGRDRTVVGLVENPSDLSDEFALTSPADREQAETVTILVGATASDEELAQVGALGDNVVIDSRDVVDERALAAVGVLGVVTVALVLVSLVAAAGFVVLAQRRARQLGMLGAIGATEKNLRLVVVANGVVVGVVAAVLGTVAGIAAWVMAVSRMEHAVGHRIEALNVPWWVVAAAMTLVVLAATAAAWWPARAVARMPITRALSGRPPKPQPMQQSVAFAAVLLAVGVVCLALADRSNGLLITVGTVASVAGVLLVSPLAIRGVACAVSGLPIAMRLALRDMARHQARSGIALAAIGLTLGVPVAIVVVSSAAEATTELGNLSERQLLVWTRDPGQPEGVSPYYTEDPNDEGFSPYLPQLTSGDLDDLAIDVDRIAAELDEATVVGLELVTDPALETPDGRLAVTLGRPIEGGYVDAAPLFVATAELLDLYDVNKSALNPDTEVLSLPVEQLDAGLPSEARRMLVSNDFVLSNTSLRGRPEVVDVVEPLASSYSSLPGSFITPEAASRRGWQPVRVGWLVESASPITAEQRLAAREIAVESGMLVETRSDPQPSLVTVRWAATAIGMVVALGVLAMTVGLVRLETAGEVRTLTAAGATGGIRRTLAAATTGSLALLGAILGTAGAYLALVAGYLGDIGALTPVPVVNLLAITVGIPTVAATAGWLLAGREPPALARQAME
jgi:putative ABC transport system permease protein